MSQAQHPCSFSRPLDQDRGGTKDSAPGVSEGNINNLKFLQHSAIAGGDELKKLLESLLRDSLAARA
jgi:hypothetical protein